MFKITRNPWQHHRFHGAGVENTVRHAFATFGALMRIDLPDFFISRECWRDLRSDYSTEGEQRCSMCGFGARSYVWIRKVRACACIPLTHLWQQTPVRTQRCLACTLRLSAPAMVIVEANSRLLVADYLLMPVCRPGLHRPFAFGAVLADESH